MFNNLDDTILESMLKLEDYYLINSNYLNETIDNETRSTLAIWMLEVCEEENCTNLCFNLAMNIFDRFMLNVKNSKLNINKSYLQLIGTACLFLSSKLRASKPIDALKLVEYTDNCIQFSFYSSSMIAYACLMCSIDGLAKKDLTKPECSHLGSKLVQLLANYIQIDEDCLGVLTEQVSLLLNKTATSSVLSCDQNLDENKHQACGTIKESKKRSSTCSSISSSSSLMDFECTHISSCCLTPPLANQLPLPNF